MRFARLMPPSDVTVSYLKSIEFLRTFSTLLFHAVLVFRSICPLYIPPSVANCLSSIGRRIARCVYSCLFQEFTVLSAVGNRIAYSYTFRVELAVFPLVFAKIPLARYTVHGDKIR